jgi:hypothetical protein
MKLVREHINEKFTIDSDPVHDLDIGMKAAWDSIKSGSILRITKPINRSHPKNSYVVVEGINNRGADYIQFSYYGYKNKEALLKHGNTSSKYHFHYGWHISFDFFKEYMELVYLPDLNEKFSKDSDPIQDMGISGIYIEDIVREIKDVDKQYENRIYITFEGNKVAKIQMGVKGYYGKEEFDYVRKILKKTNYNHIFRGFQVNPTYDNELLLYTKPEYRNIIKYTHKHPEIEKYHYWFYSEESLNEKFTSDSDPISDLGIGLMSEVRKFFAEYKEDLTVSEKINKDYTELDEMLLLCVDKEKYTYVEYLLSIGANPNTSIGIHEKGYCSLPLRYAIWHNNVDIVELLIKYGGDIAKCGITDESHLGEFINMGHYLSEELKTIIRSSFKNKSKRISKNKAKSIFKKKADRTDESIVNEKFTGDSDPIHDLGIGMKVLIEKFLSKFEDGLKWTDRYKLQKCIEHKHYDFAEYIILHSKNLKSDYIYILSDLAYHRNWEGMKYLISKGASLNGAIRYAKKCHLDHTTQGLLDFKTYWANIDEVS